MKITMSFGWILLFFGAGLIGGYYAGTRLFSAVNKAEMVRNSSRKLWVEHAVWTRDYIIQSVSKLGGMHDTFDRLLQNQDALGDFFRPYYGSDIAAQITVLLKEHVTIASDLLKALQNHAKKTTDDLLISWHKNADALAKLLQNTNPHFVEHDIQPMMYEHMKLTKQEMELRIKKEWKEDITNFDAVLNQTLELADVIFSGMAKHFPSKF